MISKKFKNHIKLFGEPVSKMAWEIGSTPAQLYHLLNHHQKISYDDDRLFRLADRIKFPRRNIFSREK